VTWARRNGVASVASVHTRFETYPRYYGVGFLEPLLVKMLVRFYNRFDTVMTTGTGMSDLLAGWGVTAPMTIWSRGVNHARFNPGMRSLEWRRSHGIADDEVVVGYLGRLVLEKGLGVFADVIARLEAQGVKHRVMVIGEGPARDWFAERVPGAVFTGFQSGDDLGRAVASMDIFFNPSITESFGNVTLEAMASGVAVVAAYSTGPIGLIEDGVSGVLVRTGSGAVDRYADAVRRYCESDDARHAAGAAGHATALRYHWDLINQAAVDTFLDVAGKRAG